MRTNEVARISVAIIACGAITGCAIYDPYVRFRGTDDTYDHHFDQPKTKSANEPAYFGSLPRARDDAGRLAGRYERAAATHAMVKTSAATLLLAAATGGLYGAATHPRPNSDLVPAIGFASAGILAAGGLLVSPTRQDIYLAGRDALICARSATDAYLISETDYNKYLSPDDASALGSVLQATNLKYARVLEFKNMAAATVPLQEAKTQIDLSSKTQADAEALRSRIWLAGPRLRAQTESINNEVDKQLRSTEPDFSKIKGALALTPTQTWPALGAASPGTKAQGLNIATLNADQTTAVNDLLAATATLAASTRAVDSFVRSVIAAESAGPSFGTCKVKAVTPALQVRPSAPAQVKQGGSPWTVSVTSSEGNPSAVADPADGLAVKPKVGAGAHDYIFEVSADKTATGTHVLHVVSASESERQDVPFQVVDMDGNSAAPGAANAPLATTPIWLTDTVATALGVKKTDDWTTVKNAVKASATRLHFDKPWSTTEAGTVATNVEPTSQTAAFLAREFQQALTSQTPPQK